MLSVVRLPSNATPVFLLKNCRNRRRPGARRPEQRVWLFCADAYEGPGRRSTGRRARATACSLFLPRRRCTEIVTPQLTTQQLETLANGVRIVALRLLGDADAAPDVAQETMARVLDALGKGQVRDPERLGAFARGVAHHVIADYRRAAGRLVALPDDLASELTTNPLDALVRDEEIARMRVALERLSSTDRELIQLTFIECLSPRALAARLHEPSERVRKRKSRALERLRELFFRTPASHVPSLAPTIEQPTRGTFAEAE
jgi:RNA polymerase sigma factor (sigma-70 family)